MVFDISMKAVLSILQYPISVSDAGPQKVQTVQSWLAEANTSVVDAKLADHVLIGAQTAMRTAVRKNLEEPHEHFQNYGERL